MDRGQEPAAPDARLGLTEWTFGISGGLSQRFLDDRLNLFMVAGPQSVSGSTNFPRAIETGVDWITGLIEHAVEHGCRRLEAEPDAERAWVDEVVGAYERLLIRGSKGWFTGYNSNVAGHHEGTIRYQAYFGGGPRYAAKLSEVAADGYRGINMAEDELAAT